MSKEYVSNSKGIDKGLDITPNLNTFQPSVQSLSTRDYPSIRVSSSSTTPNDTNTDIIWRNSVTGENVVWSMNGTNLSSDKDILAVPDSNWKTVGTGDFNHDGNTDILWRNSATGENVVWFMKGNTLASTQDIFPVPDLKWNLVGTGDFNKDGNTDILWRNSATGEDVVWFMNGTTLASTQDIFAVPDRNWNLVGTGDFNKDGNTDILWRNSATGEDVAWFMNGTTLSSTHDIFAVPSLDWNLVVTGDFNKDGNADILWRNSATGEDVVWFMNGTTLSSTQNIQPAIPDTNWHIVGTGNFHRVTPPFPEPQVTEINAPYQFIDSGVVDYTHPDRYYHFKLVADVNANVTASLTDLNANADLELLDSNFNVYQFGGEAISKSSGNAPEFISRILQSGDYYIDVKQQNGDTNYKLEFNLVPLSGKLLAQSGHSYKINLWSIDDNGKSYSLPGIDPSNAHVNQGIGIDPNKNTVIVIHGWNNDDTTDAIGRLARLASTFTNTVTHEEIQTSLISLNTQVLALDWGDIAKAGLDAIGSITYEPPLKTAHWIEPVARWAATTLEELGISPSKISLFGHSLGAYVSSEIGRIFNQDDHLDKVNTLVALDPAYPSSNYDIDGYGRHNVNRFDSVANRSLAFVAADNNPGILGIAGDNDMAATADDSFVIKFTYDQTKHPLGFNFIDAHGAVVDVFSNYLYRRLSLPTNLKIDWYDNKGNRSNSGKHEGVINASEMDDGGIPWHINDVTYVYDNYGDWIQTEFPESSSVVL